MSEVNGELFEALEGVIIALKDRIEAIESRLADLEFTLDELPEVGNIAAAVQELQELHEAPASKFTHYISGVKQ